MRRNNVIILRMASAFAEKLGKQLGEAMFYADNAVTDNDKKFWEERLEMIDGEIAEFQLQLKSWRFNVKSFTDSIDNWAKIARDAKIALYGGE